MISHLYVHTIPPPLEAAFINNLANLMIYFQPSLTHFNILKTTLENSADFPSKNECGSEPPSGPKPKAN